MYKREKKRKKKENKKQENKKKKKKEREMTKRRQFKNEGKLRGRGKLTSPKLFPYWLLVPPIG